VDQIEAIVAKIESGELGLEESIVAYERAAALLKVCRGELSKAEQKVTELSKAMAEAAKQSPGA
jgi:exodeoxyribonuclease VII small subunit